MANDDYREPQPAEQTPMDRLRDVGLLPNVDRAQLRQIIADAVAEVQDRLDKLEREHAAQKAAWPRRRPRGRP
jgi:hypothetical protein